MILGRIRDQSGFALDDSDLRADADGYTADLLPPLAREVSRRGVYVYHRRRFARQFEWGAPSTK